MVLIAGCSSGEKTELFPEIYFSPEYARGFEIRGLQGGESRVVRVKAAWQGADSTAMDLFIARGGENPPEGFEGQVIRGEARRIVAMSSSYIAMLDLLGAVDRTVAVSGIDYISNSYIRESAVVDVGSEANADFEKLVLARPDLVLLYGITASCPMEVRLKSLGIPYLYMGEYIEAEPLGRAEWLVALGEAVGLRPVAETVFGEIAERYNSLKKLVSESVTSRPKVMLNVPYGDNWFMSPRGTAMGALIEDAWAEYVYNENVGNESLPVDLEKAFLLASEADFWLNTGRISSLGELVVAYPKFAGVPSLVSGNVYNCDRRLSPGGGNDFWESGSVRPDIVLNDLIVIFHPGLLEDKLFYYRKLE